MEKTSQASLNLIPTSESPNSILSFVNWSAQAHLLTVYFYVKPNEDEGARMLQTDIAILSVLRSLWTF